LTEESETIQYPFQSIENSTRENAAVESNISLSQLEEGVFSKVIIHWDAEKELPCIGPNLDFYTHPDNLLESCAGSVHGYEVKKGLFSDLNNVFRRCLIQIYEKSRSEQFIAVLNIQEMFIMLSSQETASVQISNISHHLLSTLKSDQTLFEYESVGKSEKPVIKSCNSVAINSIIDFICNDLHSSQNVLYKIWSSTPFIGGTLKRPQVTVKNGFIEIQGVVFGNLLKRTFSEDLAVLRFSRLF
jgi:hypothetical protein